MEVNIHAILTSALDKVTTGQLHAPTAFIPGKEHSVPIRHWVCFTCVGKHLEHSTQQ